MAAPTVDSVEYRLLEIYHNDNSPFTIDDKDGRPVIVLNIPERYMLADIQSIQTLDKDGNLTQRLIRYLPQASSIFMDEQIKAGFPQKERAKYSQRLDLELRHGVLIANKVMQKKFLAACAWNEAFPEELRMPDQKVVFREYVPAKEKSREYDAWLTRVAAANKVIDMSMEEAKDMLILWNPTGHVPEEWDELTIKKELSAIINEVHQHTNQSGADFINGGVASAESKLKVLIGRAETLGVLSMSAHPGSVSISNPKSTKNPWVPIASISDTGGLASKVSNFVNYLLVAKDGKELTATITAMVLKASPAAKEEKKEVVSEPA